MLAPAYRKGIEGGNDASFVDTPIADSARSALGPKGAVDGCVLQLATIGAMFAAAVGPYQRTMWAVPLLDFAVISLLIWRWNRRGKYKTVSGFLIVIGISAIVLVPCWGILLNSAHP